MKNYNDFLVNKNTSFLSFLNPTKKSLFFINFREENKRKLVNNRMKTERNKINSRKINLQWKNKTRSIGIQTD